MSSKSVTVLGSKSAAALTTSLSGWELELEVPKHLRVSLMFAYVYDSATSVEIQFLRSDDGSTYYLDERESATLGTFEADEQTEALGASTNFVRFADVSDCRYFKVQAKRTGGSASDTLACVAVGGETQGAA